MRLYLVLILLGFCQFVFGQDSLELKKGFQDIILGSNPGDYAGLEFKKKTSDEEVPDIDLYLPKKGYYESVGNIAIRKMKVKSFDNKIYEIEIIADKDPNFYKGLERKYGEGQYFLPTNSYVWGGEGVRLSFQSHSKNKVILTYRSTLLIEWIKAKEKEKVKSVADDF